MYPDARFNYVFFKNSVQILDFFSTLLISQKNVIRFR